MAEVQTTATNPKRQGIRSKKLSTRVDLTPMVDLGFLLITFFIFTTTLAQPKVMKLSLPMDSEKETDIGKSKVMTIILEKNDSIAWYSGDNVLPLQHTNFSAAGIRSVIQHHKQAVSKITGKLHQEYIIIKPTEDCDYKNVVDILDEMLINDIKSYTLADLSTVEASLITKK